MLNEANCLHPTEGLFDHLASSLAAQIYNWWSFFVRLASPGQHHEIVTSRPQLLNSIVRQTFSGGQRILAISSTHTQAHHVADFFTQLAKELRQFSLTAEQ